MAQNTAADDAQTRTRNAAVAAALRKAATNLAVAPSSLPSDTANKVGYNAGTKELERSPLSGQEFDDADLELFESVYAATYGDLDASDLRRVASEIDPL